MMAFIGGNSRAQYVWEEFDMENVIKLSSYAPDQPFI